MKPAPKTSTTNHGSYMSYAFGFILSLELTVGAYLFVVHDVMSSGWLLFTISLLAIIQLFIQLLFFLHLGKEPKPRWNLMVLLFAVLVVVIVVFGSLWIMHNLDYHMTDHTETEIIKDEGIQR